MNSNSRKPAMRVLLVEDHELFRKFIGSVLEKQPDLQLVGEAEDGPVAVRKCAELQPDLALLDIGLPGLNGIEVARQIRRVNPACRIVFLTQENCAEIVQEAFGLGAAAYVIKAQTASDLIPAILAARDGRQFVSPGVEGYKRPPVVDRNVIDHVLSCETMLSPRAPAPHHYARFYRDHQSISAGYAAFIKAALKGGKGVLTVITPEHRDRVFRSLRASRIDTGAAVAAGRFVVVDALRLIKELTFNGRLDLDRLYHSAVQIVESLMSANPHARICACGELAPSLLAQGNPEVALQVERLWDEISRCYDMELLCGYLLDDSQLMQGTPIYGQICAAHAPAAVH